MGAGLSLQQVRPALEASVEGEISAATAANASTVQFPNAFVASAVVVLLYSIASHGSACCDR
jgi:hypothetical protein